MMRMNNIKMTTIVDREELLAKLKENLANHSQIVKEAREGYVKKAKEVLEERLKELVSGKIVSLTFHIRPPADYSKIYQNSIEMLNWHKEPTVELEADEFSQMVRDEWDWSEDFFGTNKAYSRMADDIGGSRGY